jgi:hypothetical protein
MKVHQAYFARDIHAETAQIRRLLALIDAKTDALDTFGLKDGKRQIGALRTLREEILDYSFCVWHAVGCKIRTAAEILQINPSTLRQYLRERQKRIDCEQ